jgi:hypothetical protein
VVGKVKALPVVAAGAASTVEAGAAVGLRPSTMGGHPTVPGPLANKAAQATVSAAIAAAMAKPPSSNIGCKRGNDAHLPLAETTYGLVVPQTGWAEKTLCSLAGRDLDRIRKRPLKQVEAKRQPALVWLLEAVDQAGNIFCALNAVGGAVGVCRVVGCGRVWSCSRCGRWLEGCVSTRLGLRLRLCRPGAA